MLLMIEAHTVIRGEMSPHQNHLYCGSRATELVLVTAFCRQHIFGSPRALLLYITTYTVLPHAPSVLF